MPFHRQTESYVGFEDNVDRLIRKPGTDYVDNSRSERFSSESIGLAIGDRRPI